MTHVVFDIGAVLIDWNPRLAWADELGLEGAGAFLERIDFAKLNFACDAGARFADAAAEIKDREDARRLTEYVSRFQSTIPHKIEESWEMLFALKDAGRAVHAITNWSAETWPEGVKAHPELGTVFGTTVVSGQVGLVKPSVEIYRLLCDLAEVRPEECVFIDDGLHNCIGAKAAGMDAIHFTGPDALRQGLTERGLL